MIFLLTNTSSLVFLRPNLPGTAGRKPLSFSMGIKQSSGMVRALMLPLSTVDCSPLPGEHPPHLHGPAPGITDVSASPLNMYRTPSSLSIFVTSLISASGVFVLPADSLVSSSKGICSGYRSCSVDGVRMDFCSAQSYHFCKNMLKIT